MTEPVIRTAPGGASPDAASYGIPDTLIAVSRTGENGRSRRPIAPTVGTLRLSEESDAARQSPRGIWQAMEHRNSN